MPRPSLIGSFLIGGFSAASLSAAGLLLCATQATATQQEFARDATAPSGIRFHCTAGQLPRMRRDMLRYLAELDIGQHLYVIAEDPAAGQLRFALSTPPEDTGTLDFHTRPEFGIPPQLDWMPTATGTPRAVQTVSDKEIVLALMQHGRLSEFPAGACDIAALREHVGIRRNIVAWAESLEWGWPDGGPARWHRKYWSTGKPAPRRSLRQAVNDAFFNQAEYEIGCYAATKLVVVQGILDYYHRIKPDRAKARLVEARLLQDKAPLAGIEPGRMWSFEADVEPDELARPGKILRLAHGVAARNFVPGDWAHFLNTDPASYQKTGYEGSNPIYLGRNRFADYYNDHGHFYSFEEKLDEVYQWRHGVFSRRRDKDRIVPLSPDDYERLDKTPENGGLLIALRATPYCFGFEKLPGSSRQEPVNAPSPAARPSPARP